jgi:very-short-patch-repair endonuclease
MTTLEKELRISEILKSKYNCDVVTNENRPYTLYNVKDIARVLGIKNIRSIMMSYNDTEKSKIIKQTRGGNQKVTYITYDALIKLLLKSRKPESIEISKEIELDKKTKHYACIESDIIKCILKTFDGNIMIPQYRVNQYYIDLYFPEYLLAIECDELHHNTKKNKLQDEIRFYHITRKLHCRVIRFNPFEKNFNIFGLLNDIYIHLAVFPRRYIDEGVEVKDYYESDTEKNEEKTDIQSEENENEEED